MGGWRIAYSILIIVLLSGCLCSEGVDFGCTMMSGKDQDHCFQKAAVELSDPDMCDKIKAKTFTVYQGPAPRDKCYMLIAEKTGDPDPCFKIIGGKISYTRQECLYKAAQKSKDEKTCNKIQGSHQSFVKTYSKETCLKALGVSTSSVATSSTTSTTIFEPFNRKKNYCGPEGKFGMPRSHVLSKADFNPACYNHDKCYEECKTKGYSQKYCDDQFYSTMDASCGTEYSQATLRCSVMSNINPLKLYCYSSAEMILKSCKTQATAYWSGVAAGGRLIGAYPC